MRTPCEFISTFRWTTLTTKCNDQTWENDSVLKGLTIMHFYIRKAGVVRIPGCSSKIQVENARGGLPS